MRSLRMCLLTAALATLLCSVGCASGGEFGELAKLSYEEWVRCLAFSPDGKTLALGTHRKPGAPSQGEVIFWETATWKRRAAFTCDQWVNHLAFSPDGKWLAASCSDGDKAKEGIVVVFDLHTSKITATFTCEDLGNPKNHFGEVRFSSDGKSLLTTVGSAKGRKVQIYGVPKYDLKNEISIDDWGTLSNDGKLFATSYGICELPSGKMRDPLYPLKNARNMFFSPSGSILVLFRDFDFSLVDVVNENDIDVPGLTDEKFRADVVAISADEKILAASSHVGKETTLHLFDLGKRKKLFEWETKRPILQLGFSPDGKTITDGYRVWSVPKR